MFVIHVTSELFWSCESDRSFRYHLEKTASYEENIID